MGYFLAIIKKQWQGKEFANTYGIYSGSGEGPVTPEELGPMLTQSFLTNTGDLLGTLTEDNIFWSLLAFERTLFSESVQFTKLLLTDRTNYQQGPDTVRAYKSYSLNFYGDRADQTPQTMEVGNVILSLTRRSVGVSSEDGELELRTVLNKEDTRNIGPNMLDWSSTQARDKYSTLLTSAINYSALERWMGFTSAGEPFLVVPRYTSKARGDAVAGNIIGGAKIDSLIIAGPRPRQVRKGKNAKKETP